MDIETLITDLQVGGEKIVYNVEYLSENKSIYTFALHNNYGSCMAKYNHKLHCMRTFKADTLRTALNMYINELRSFCSNMYKFKLVTTGELIERV